MLGPTPRGARRPDASPAERAMILLYLIAADDGEEDGVEDTFERFSRFGGE